MKLFLLRHAHARDTFPDELRELSAKGLAQLDMLAAAISPEIFANLAQVWVSPFARARQSAEIFAGRMGIAANMSVSPALTPCADPGELARMIAGIAGFGADLLIVAHNPLLENLAASLLGKNGGAAAFGTATLGCLSLAAPPSGETPNGAWALEMLVNPGIFRSASRAAFNSSND